jgi:hypothetical protein
LISEKRDTHAIVMMSIIHADTKERPTVEQSPAFTLLT